MSTLRASLNAARLLKAAVALPLLLLANSASAQFYDSRVVDKAFEENQAFFSPGLLNPYGISGFGDAAIGLIRHPLLDLQVNPSRVSSDSLRDVFAYVDFRRTPTEQPDYYYGGCPYCRYDLAVTDDLSRSFLPYPYYGGYERQPLRPILGAALLGRPIPGKPVIVGATYQLVFKDEPYYAVPYDIYRSVATEDFTGRGVTDGQVPFYDGSSGEDGFRTSGHLVNLHSFTSVGPIAVGGRLGLAVNTLDGSRGNQSAWTTSAGQVERSFWSDLEERGQDYRHIDLELGLRYALSPYSSAGITVGGLRGSASQELIRTDTSFYSHGLAVPEQDEQQYLRGGNTTQKWDRDGTSAWIGFDFDSAIGSRRADRQAARLFVVYRGTRTDQDLESQSVIRDSTFSEYTGGISSSSSSSTLDDRRSGSGTRDGWSHRIATGIRWPVGRRSQVTLGLNVNTKRQQTAVSERADLFQHSRSEWTHQGRTESWLYRREAEQVLNWDMDVRSTIWTVPLYATTNLSEYVTLEFGLNRSFALLDLTDETIVQNIRAIETTNGQTRTRDGLSERYREPRVRESDIRTAFLAGATLRPTRGLDVRVLLAPVLREYYGESDIEWRWWIGFEITQ